MDSNKINIYFCGSIRGVAANLATYTRIIATLKTYGNVLTEHIVNPSLVPGLDDKGLYSHDWNAFMRADIMIAETTAPSHGVGIELGWAISHQKIPVLSIASKEKQYNSSALITGCPLILHQEYQSEEEALKIIEDFIKKHFYYDEELKTYQKKN